MSKELKVWKVLLKERMVDFYGFAKMIYILEGPTFPCCFYTGPVLDSQKVENIRPLYNSTDYYSKTQDAALDKLSLWRK